MLDSFEILTTSGVVLWSKSYAPVKSSLINGFIKDVFIEETVPGGNPTSDAAAAHNPSYRKEQKTLRWTSVKELGLIFVAVYQSLLHLTWIDKLLDNVRIIFTDLYGDQLRKPYTSVMECDFDAYFEQQLKELEGSAINAKPAPQINIQDSSSNPAQIDVIHRYPQSDGTLTADDGLSAASTPDTSRPSTPASQIISGGQQPKGTSRRARKAASTALNVASSGDERRPKAKKDTKKRMRRWDDSGAAGEDDGETLDYSAQSNGAIKQSEATSASQDPMNADTSGTRTTQGQYVLKDLDSEVHSMLQHAEDQKVQQEPADSKGILGSGIGAISGLFRNVIGGKVLTKADLEKPLKGMKDHLISKNVAQEAAIRLCESVERELLGVKTGNFESIETTIRTALSNSLRQLLTPTTSLDILRAITAVTQASRTPLSATRRPYVISIVGVNGVGKSTNLSKLGFFLLQNKFSLLIAACDTFRSGAVEQLRVHARHLKELSEREQLGKVELYERGYGKDAANIAKDAISYADGQSFDVVLIDTAGRRHNDARLMSSLEKFAQFAKPDKILMVGEALVGTDSVAQARAFDKAFGSGRRLDGFIISKCDTVGEMVGTLVSMVHATGIPVVFLGVGQHYGDLRTLNVSWAVKMLMS